MLNGLPTIALVGIYIYWKLQCMGILHSHFLFPIKCKASKTPKEFVSRNKYISSIIISIIVS